MEVGMRGRQNDAEGTSRLTNRELECIKLVADGGSAKEIGQLIGVAPRTVEKHLDQARLKLGAKNRAHLVAAAFSIGLI